MSIKRIIVRQVFKSEEKKYKELMQRHHYLGFVPKIGETMWHIATTDNECVSLIGFSASALKCKVRNEWIEFMALPAEKKSKLMRRKY